MAEHVTIIGNGKVGSSLHGRLIERGISVTVVTRGEFDKWCSSTLPIGDVLIVATKDNVLQAVVERIVQTRAEHLTDVLVIHVNGSLGLEPLETVHSVNALAAAAHPFQTFGGTDPSALNDIGWGVQCDDAAWPRIRGLVELLGGIPWLLTDVSHERKRRYHASAVAASNFTYAAYELARLLANEADIPAEVFLIPIMRRTLENAENALSEHRPFPLTGPIVRGDADALRLQFESIPVELRGPYRDLSRALLGIVEGTLEASAVDRLKDVLA